MNRPDPLLARFFAAEAEGRDEAAEAALGELLRALPRPLPRAGFAERTALAALLDAPEAGRARAMWIRRWEGVALALCLAATGLGLPLLPVALAAIRLALGRITLAGSAALAVRGMSLLLGELGGGVAGLLSVWQRLMPLRQALAAALASPAVASGVGLCLLISALALRFLHDLVERERSWTHAHPTL